MKIVFPGGKEVDAFYKGFTIKTDQALHNGGDGSNPQPFDLFLASIGTCAGSYILSFCDERSISTKNICLFLQTEKNKETKMIDRIRIEIKIPVEFPEKYRKAIIRAAELCAVTKHLKKPPNIDIVINEKEESDEDL